MHNYYYIAESACKEQLTNYYITT